MKVRLLVIAGWATAILPVNNCRFILILFNLFHEANTRSEPSKPLHITNPDRMPLLTRREQEVVHLVAD